MNTTTIADILIDNEKFVEEVNRRAQANIEAVNKRKQAIRTVIRKYYKNEFVAIQADEDERYEQCLAEIKALNVEETYPLPYPFNI